MTALDTPVTVNVNRDTSTYTQLTGRRLWAARAIWLAVIGLSVTLFVVAIPFAWAYFIVPCDTDCRTRPYALPADSAAELAAAGASIEVWAGIQIGLAVVLMAVSVAVAVIIYRQRSDDWVALAISAMVVTYGAYNTTALPPLAAAVPWLAPPAEVVTTLGFALFTTYAYFFPSGRFVPRWTIIIIPILALSIAASFFVPQLGPGGQAFLPGGPRIVLSVYLICVLVGVLAQVYRYLRVSTPVQRRQSAWVLAGLAGLILLRLGTSQVLRVIYPDAAAMGHFPLPGLLTFQIIFAASALLIPLSFGIAITRYRLWDIDFVINRALVLGIMAVLFVVLAAGSLFAISQFATDLPGGPLVGVAIGAAIFGVAFNPVYKECRAFVDRLYGIKLDYVEAVKAYGGTKREARKTGDTKESFGSYTGLTLLGKGGMGEVYRAQHPTLNRAVAIKILPEHKGGDEAEKRFEREAQTIAKLKHSNIVTLHDVGEQDGQPYMVMEYIDGQDLSDVLRQRDRLPLSEALPILNDVAAALDYAHTQGVIHRDIKPSNVMVEKTTATGAKQGVKAVLMDFGIAKSYVAATRLTHSGGMIGTLDYISPEQIQGAAEVDARADIYSFGVMAYQVLTGKLPFAHNNPGAMVLAHLNQPPPDPRESVSDLPDSAAIAVMRAMSKKPEQRFDTAGAFIAAMG